MSTLEDALGAVATNLAEAGMALDPDIGEQLKPLEGRILKLESTMPVLTFYLTVSDGSPVISGQAEHPPHVVISGRGTALAAWLVNPQHAESVTIEGDTIVLQEFSQVLQSFDPELIAPLTNLLGAETAQNILGTAELAVSALRSAAEGVGAALEQTAASRFVTKEDTGALLDVLDDLRLRIDRLAARIDEQDPPG